MANTSLKNCPFCGGEAELLKGAPGLYSAENHLYHAKCQSCGASAYDHGRDGAIAAWNRRTPPAVPEGWVLVPKDPTEEMHDAARDWSAKKYGKPIGTDASDGCYRAMLAAAPAAP